MRVVEGCEGHWATGAETQVEDEGGREELEEGAGNRWGSEPGGEVGASGRMGLPNLQS